MFYLQNRSNLRVLNGGGESDVIDQNGSLVGVMDVIRDYAAGELIDIGGVQAVNPPVEVNAGHPVLANGEYTFVHGSLASPGHFDVSSTGQDLLLIYDRDDQQGALVLIGVTDAADVALGVILG